MDNDEMPAASGAAADPGRHSARPATVPPHGSDLASIHR